MDEQLRAEDELATSNPVEDLDPPGRAVDTIAGGRMNPSGTARPTGPDPSPPNGPVPIPYPNI